MSLLKITNLQFCWTLQHTNYCFASADVTAPFMKCDEGQWSNDIIVNTDCDVTRCGWHCLDNHISQQWVGDVAAAQGGASVQLLYYKALTELMYFMGTCQMLLLQIHFNIYSALNENKLVFKHDLIWPHLWLTQPVAFDRTGNWLNIREYLLCK